MEGRVRRKKIEELLANSKNPLSGTELARRFEVSRQVIVQDIALLRAENKDILSTNKGYLIFTPAATSGVNEVICVRHTADEAYDEMKTIVELGGKLRDVIVDHDFYGQIHVDLIINDLKDVEEFVRTMKESKSKPLKVLTDDVHFHTVYAPSDKIIKLIKSELREKGYLVE